MKKLIFTIAMVFSLGIISRANNIQITNVSVSGTNVTFDIAWENSWNSMNNVDTNYPRNWDAAWIFVKVQSNADNLWKHQNVSTTSAAHSVTGGILQADAVSDGVGVFIRRTNPGSGNVSATATLSMQSLPAGVLNFKVFGIEMVNIPQGSFYVNDGGSAGNRFNNYTVTSSAVTSGSLFGGQPTLAANYPTGYQAIYSAKYETSNAQMVDFLNCLTYDQQLNLTDNAPNGVRNTIAFSTGSSNANKIIEIDTPGVSATKPAIYGNNYTQDAIHNNVNDGQNIACIAFTVQRAIAYLDWCGLRPMTDMEYEKICRGTKYTGVPNPRVLNEYPWGTTNLTAYSATAISYIGTDSARRNGAVVNGRAMVNGFNIAYPAARCGLFAQSGTGREAAGAAFYGVMDLTGNARDLAFFTNATNNSITMSSLGDGNLTTTLGPTNGDGNVAGWSDYSTNTYWGNKGFGTYGAVGVADYHRVSNRQESPITTSYLTTTYHSQGVRGVR